jgi:hypothetical protein
MGACQKTLATAPPSPPNGEAQTLHRGEDGTRFQNRRTSRRELSSPVRRARQWLVIGSSSLGASSFAGIR